MPVPSRFIRKISPELSGFGPSSGFSLEVKTTVPPSAEIAGWDEYVKSPGSEKVRRVSFVPSQSIRWISSSTPGGNFV